LAKSGAGASGLCLGRAARNFFRFALELLALDLKTLANDPRFFSCQVFKAPRFDGGAPGGFSKRCELAAR
jgi:hypothetical protein